jgi:hypothetical protein
MTRGGLAALSGDLQRADAFREEGLALARSIGAISHLAIALSDMGNEAEMRGDLATALDRYRESLALCGKIDAEWSLAHPLAGIASAASTAGRADCAARLLGAVSVLHETRGTKPYYPEQARDAQAVARTRAALSTEAYEREFDLGRGLPVEEVVQQALAVADDLRVGGL